MKDCEKHWISATRLYYILLKKSLNLRGNNKIADHKIAEKSYDCEHGWIFKINACTSDMFHVVNSDCIVHASPQWLRLSQPAIFMQSSQSKRHCCSAQGLNQMEQTTHTKPIKAALETRMGRQHVSSAPLSENTSSNTTRLTHAEKQRCAEDPKKEDVKMNPLLSKP